MSIKPATKLIHINQSSRLDDLTIMGRGIAHDFNNLLSAINGNAFIVKQAVTDNEVAKNSIEQIENCTSRAIELTSSIHLYTGCAPFNQTKFSLNKLIEDICSGISLPHIKMPGIKLKLIPEIVLHADIQQTSILIRNLVFNAAEAMIERTGNITVHADITQNPRELSFPDNLPAGKYAVIRIEDCGKGIPHKIEQKIFNPFFTTKLRGKGLGLSVVLGVIRAHSGGLIVKSCTYYGSSFTALFPIN